MREPAIRHIPASFDQLAAKLGGAPDLETFQVVSVPSGFGGLDLGFLGGFPHGSRYCDRLPFEVVRGGDSVDLPSGPDVVIGNPCRELAAAARQLRPSVFVAGAAEDNDGLPRLRGYRVARRVYAAADFGVPSESSWLFAVGARDKRLFVHPDPPADPGAGPLFPEGFEHREGDVPPVVAWHVAKAVREHLED